MEDGIDVGQIDGQMSTEKSEMVGNFDLRSNGTRVNGLPPEFMHSLNVVDATPLVHYC